MTFTWQVFVFCLMYRDVVGSSRQRQRTQSEDTNEDSSSKPANLDDFNSQQQINDWLSSIQTVCPSGLICSVHSVGLSYERRAINLFKITKSGRNRKAYWLDGTTHAREWLVPATLLKIINRLIRGYGNDAVVTQLLDKYDWYILPVVNPDGYEYSRTTNRMWRKNRRPSGTATKCIGIDINRNFDYLWGTGKGPHSGSTDPCSEVYIGPFAASEPETRAIQTIAKYLSRSVLAWLTLHAYAKTWTFPFANEDNEGKCVLAKDHEDLMAVADAAADATQATYKTMWDRGNTCELIYDSPGGTDDYVKAVQDIKYAYTVELRGNNFQVDKSQIDKSYREIWNGLVAMVNKISDIEGL